MEMFIKILIDFVILALVYFICLYPKWKRQSKSVLTVNTLMYVYLSGVMFVTLMPVAANLLFCFNHPYVPMNMVAFEDAIIGRENFVWQIVLNVIMTIPFGILLPLCRRLYGKRCGFVRCLLFTLGLSLFIELFQPLINAARNSDITDIITNTSGGVIGFCIYQIFRPLTDKIFFRDKKDKA